MKDLFAICHSMRLHFLSIALMTVSIPALVSAQETITDGPWVDFTAAQWEQLEKSIDLGLHWLSSQQSDNGSIGYRGSSAQPAHTSLATMAFLSRGHQPGQGLYGQQLERAIDFVLSTQDRYGFFVSDSSYKSGGTTYSHAISGVMLAEVIGMTDQKRNERIAEALRRGLDATEKLQQRHSLDTTDRGGWRYIMRKPGNADADLSVSTWHLLFLRAAKNAGYPVPESLVNEASDFVRRCFNSGSEQFSYLPGRTGSITMTGAGTLSLFLAGQYDDPAARSGVRTLQNYNFSQLSSNNWPYYTCYHCSQAASQAGGEARNKVLKGITMFLLEKQTINGSWPGKGSGELTGSSYTTPMAILSLTPSYQILPIYQQ